MIVKNRFKPLCDLVDHQGDIETDSRGVELLSEQGVIQGVNNTCEHKNSKQNTKNQMVNQVTDEKHMTTHIVRNIQQGKAPECVRSLNVNEIIDKCSDLKECIKQQRNPYGFLPISNLKRMQRAYSLVPNSIITDKNFDPVWMYNQVRDTGKYNYEQAKIQLPSDINFELLEKLAEKYWDYQLPMFLKFGFPLDFPKNEEGKLKSTEASHSSAIQHREHVDTYLLDEIGHQAIAGPYDQPPYGDKTQISPFMTRDKSDSEKRRVIIDLSWPQGASINHFTRPNIYLNTAYKLQYPTVDHITAYLRELGPEALIYKVDLSRAFRQLPIDPSDYNLLCLKWGEKYYSDKFCPFGHRFGSLSCSRLSDFFRYIMYKNNHVIFSYVDDLLGVGLNSTIHESFKELLQLLEDLGFPISKSKLRRPNSVCNCLGIIINVKDSTVSVPPEKLAEVIKKCQEIRNKSNTTKRGLQSVIGSLLFIHKCVTPTRFFVNRILQGLREAKGDRIAITQEMKKDFTWFCKFLPIFNGTAKFNHVIIDQVLTLEIDACLQRVGGVWKNLVYSAVIPQGLGRKSDLNITHYEMVNIVVVLRLWGQEWRGRSVIIKTDNMAVVNICKSGYTRDMELAVYIRNIWLITASLDIRLVVEHIRGKQNVTADLLSRWTGNQTDKQLLDKLVCNPSWCEVTQEHFMIDYDI